MAQKGGRDYLQLDPYTSKGLQEVLKFNKIEPSEISWDNKELHLLYADALTLVQKKGRHDDWTISTEEGLHRLTGSIIRTLACKLDFVNGFVLPNTIGAEYFAENSVGKATTLKVWIFEEKK